MPFQGGVQSLADLSTVHPSPPGNEAFVCVRLWPSELSTPFGCREAVGKEVGRAEGAGKGQSRCWE